MHQIFAFFDGDELISIAMDVPSAVYEETRCSNLYLCLQVSSVIAPTKDDCWFVLLDKLLVDPNDNDMPVSEMDDMVWEHTNAYFH